MVFFICDNCGETLKKNKVDSHIHRCGSYTVSCIDCNQHFDRKSYNEHKTCLNEDEKYGGANYQKKEVEPKGKKKQNEWIEKVYKAAQTANISPAIKSYMDTLLNYDNIPRKKAKFVNFVHNSIRSIRHDAVEQLWSIFESEIKKETGTAQSTNESNKRPLEENEDGGDTKKAKVEESNITAEIEDKGEETVKCEDKSEETNETTKPKKKKKESKKKKDHIENGSKDNDINNESVSDTVNGGADNEEQNQVIREHDDENNVEVKRMKKPKLVKLARLTLSENGNKMKRKAFEKIMVSKYHEKDDESKIEKFRTKIFEKLAKKSHTFIVTDKYVALAPK